jgi:ATP-dependent DNA helicase RecG
MNLEQLEQLLAGLRAIRTDHHTVEAKKAATGLPASTAETLSAFANTDGGWLLLGVLEGSGTFDVTGVDDPAQVMNDLRALCEQMEPPLRPQIETLHHPDGIVVAAWIATVPREQRPCHRRSLGALTSSFVRVGDGDQRLTETEVQKMLAVRTGVDHSRSPAPAGATLDPAATGAFCDTVRAVSPRNADLPDDELLTRYGVTLPRTDAPHDAEASDPPPAVDGDAMLPLEIDASQLRLPRLSVAGLLTLGEGPERVTGAARVTYRRLPKVTDPPGTRFAGTHLEGTVGQLLDDTLQQLARDLNTVQVERDGALVNELDVPREALREVLSNALVHRSFADTLREASILVEVSDDAVVITSPGSIHFGADPDTLGLDAINGVRNLTLVRIAQHLTTPRGARIVEQQASGITAADDACKNANSMPALFTDLPTAFQVTLLRHSIDPAAATAALTAAGITNPTPAALRLMSVLLRLDEIRDAAGASTLDRIAFDARLAARALRTTTEDAAAELRALEAAGALIRSQSRHHPTWVPPTPAAAGPPVSETEPVAEPPKTRKTGDRIPDLLAAIAASPNRELRPSELDSQLGFGSTATRSKWLRRATENGLIESTHDNPVDPRRAYRLTRKGEEQHRAMQARARSGTG